MAGVWDSHVIAYSPFSLNEYNGKEVMVMPTLKHLLEELGLLKVKPEDVRITGQLYDDIVADAEQSSEDEEE
jgi:hypothetical protein